MTDLSPADDEYSRESVSEPETSPRRRIVDIKAAGADPGLDGCFKLHRRSSSFLEVGLGGDDKILDAKLRRQARRPRLSVRFNSKVELVDATPIDYPNDLDPPWQRTQLQHAPPPFFFPTLPRILFLAFVIALLVPSFNNDLLRAPITPIGAQAGTVRIPQKRAKREIAGKLITRQDSPTDICVRWSQQTAVVNGTLYSYGGHTSSQPSQTQNTWNNDFVTIDLTSTWEISSPALKGLPQPSGPAVSNGYLWNSYASLYLYGGEFSDSPVTLPSPFSTWSYDIATASWVEHPNPIDVSGTNSDGGNQAVQRAAEGAGVSIPNLGRGFYFGGHLDGYTTVGWSQSIARVYLTSLLEYTFPGYSNPDANNASPAGPDGVYRNITEGGSQSSAGFPERADGVLVYIPGFGDQGILLGLAGGTNATFTQLNIIDIYDIASSTWYKQATSGPTPEIRVNPCAVAATAADGSSIQVMMYGGQNLVPYEQQIQYSDTWVLSLPSFTWIKVDTSSQSVPPARAGHTCNIWNSQMVVLGGYVGPNLSCDVPGTYVFNASSLSWQNEYVDLNSTDPLNRQTNQQNDPNALQGSYGYEVPPAVQSVIGGNAAGGATLTAPALSPSSGPLATGRPKTYSVTALTTVTTASNGQVLTTTQSATSAPTSSSGNTGGSSTPSSTSSSGGSNVAAIAAGVVAGFFAILAAYLGFCVWLYRKQLKLYKNHVAMAQRAHLSGGDHPGRLAPVGSKNSDKPSSSSNSAVRNGHLNAGVGGGTPLERVSGESPSVNSAGAGLASNNPYRVTATAASSTEDLMRGQEPSFLGVMLNPRRSLRVVNRD